MRRYLKYIAGATIVAAAALVVGKYRPGGEAIQAANGAPSAPDTAPAPPYLVAIAAPLALAESPPGESPAARIAALQADLSAREAALATLRASLAKRDASLDAITVTLTEREAELQSLRDELAALRAEKTFDTELAILKAGTAPPENVETVLAAMTGVAPQAEPSVLTLTEIIFDTGSAQLSPGGQVHAAAAAVMLAEMTVTRIRLLGFTDRVGSADRNRALAESRARAVADFLVGSGVPVELIETAGMGEADLPVNTADGVPEPLNRSVAIVAIPLPTS